MTRQRSWEASYWGLRLTHSPRWRITLGPGHLVITVGDRTFQAPISAARAVTIQPGLLWASLSFTPKGGQAIRLDGLPNAQARTLQQSLQDALADHDLQQQLANLETTLEPLRRWQAATETVLEQHRRNRRWITHETLQRLLGNRPKDPHLESLLKRPELQQHLARNDKLRALLAFWQADLSALVNARNQEHLKSELRDCRNFLDRVERTPLTTEQAHAVLCFDNRVQVIASAGSGKTSTLVAKAGYALQRGLVPANRILLLAFNADAAKELQARIRERLTPLGLPAEQVVARTFHAFGLDVIGQATGRKPTLAPWLESGQDLEHLSQLVDRLKDRDPSFRTRWDLFRLVFSRDLPGFGSAVEPGDWDSARKASGFRTLRGEVVKSHEERLIADWLFYNGVDYRYEQPYESNTATAQHRQYHPDFYYPQANAYHEHFALDAQGQPPAHFANYLEGVQWKRKLHAEQGTTLWETTSATIRSGQAFQMLAERFRQAGVKLDPNPDRPAPGRPAIEHAALVRTFRTFLTHAKSNRLSPADLQQRLQREGKGAFQFRHTMFLQLFEAIHNAWERDLREAGMIDFEDMLNQAADHLEARRCVSPYELVMVDEFQDASRARGRLTRALVQSPERHLFAVGDDWQSINRFAGADLSLMSEFSRWFGPAQVFRLEQTFRCPQSLCTVSSEFVLKNPAQLRKSVRSVQPEHPPTLQAFQVPEDSRLRAAIETYLSRLHDQLANGTLPSGRAGGPVTVYLLGRYRRDAELLAPQWATRFGQRLKIEFRTVHGSKGLEADYVILPRLTRGSYGFPSGIEDDPVLQLAMPEGDAFPHAEERRLFYVALTRARRAVALFTVQGRESEFVTELVKQQQLTLLDLDGIPSETRLCPRCQQGTLVVRTRRSDGSRFLGCSRFPACRHTSNLPQVSTMRQSGN